MTDIFRNLIKNPFVRARILACLRGLVMAAGAYLASKGFGDASTTQAAVGLAMAVAGWYFQDQDVKGVNKKIDAAIALAPKTPQATINALKQGNF